MTLTIEDIKVWKSCSPGHYYWSGNAGDERYFGIDTFYKLFFFFGFPLGLEHLSSPIQWAWLLHLRKWDPQAQLERVHSREHSDQQSNAIQHPVTTPAGGPGDNQHLCTHHIDPGSAEAIWGLLTQYYPPLCQCAWAASWPCWYVSILFLTRVCLLEIYLGCVPSDNIPPRGQRFCQPFFLAVFHIGCFPTCIFTCIILIMFQQDIL